MRLNSGSLPSRVVDFFARNPDEVLTSQDMQVKFDFDYCPAKALVRVLKDGLVAKVHQGTGAKNAPTMFGAGPKLLDRS